MQIRRHDAPNHSTIVAFFLLILVMGIFSEKKELPLSLSYSFCDFVPVIFGVGLPFRRDQDYACSQKGSRIVTVLFWVCLF